MTLISDPEERDIFLQPLLSSSISSLDDDPMVLTPPCMRFMTLSTHLLLEQAFTLIPSLITWLHRCCWCLMPTTLRSLSLCGLDTGPASSRSLLMLEREGLWEISHLLGERALRAYSRLWCYGQVCTSCRLVVWVRDSCDLLFDVFVRVATVSGVVIRLPEGMCYISGWFFRGVIAITLVRFGGIWKIAVTVERS